MADQPSSKARQSSAPSIEAWELVSLLLITAGAFVLRFWNLEAVPPGLHVDEAFNILDAKRVAFEGWRPVFLPENAGRDIVYTYLQGFLFWIFGSKLLIARSASALLGGLSIPLVWWTWRKLLGTDAALSDRKIRSMAILMAGLLAVSYWHLHFSRFGIRAIAFPIVLCLLALAYISIGLGEDHDDPPTAEGQKPSIFGVSRPTVYLAIALGLAVYTHPAGRALIALPLAHALYLLLFKKAINPLRQVLGAGLGGLLISAPLIHFWWRHPHLFFGHAGEVSILDQGLQGLIENSVKVLGMFSHAGDPARWRNLPGRPAWGEFGFWTAISPSYWATASFAFGVLLVSIGLITFLGFLYQRREWAVFSLFWLIVLSLPSVLTDAAPNFSRAIGALPVVYLLPALGFIALVDKVRYRLLPGLSPYHQRLSAAFAITGFLLFVGWRSGTDYFKVWAQHSETPLAFDADKVALARYRADREEGEVLAFLSPQMAGHPTIKLSSPDGPSRGLNPSYGTVFENDIEAETQTMYIGWDLPEGEPNYGSASRWLCQFALDGFAQGCERDWRGVYLMPGDSGDDFAPILSDKLMVSPNREVLVPLPAGIRSDGIDFGSLIRFRGLYYPNKVLRAGRRFDITLTWERLKPMDQNLTTAIHLVDENGDSITQADGPPLGGSLPTSLWREGEIIISRHILQIPEVVPGGSTQLKVGWYAPATESTPLQPLITDSGESVAAIADLELLAP